MSAAPETDRWTITAGDILTLKARLGAALDAWVAELEPLAADAPPVLELPPKNPAAVPGDGRIVLTWEAPIAGTAPTGYRYSRDGTDAGGAGPWSGDLPADARTVTLDKLVNGRPYVVTLAALYPDGQAAASVTVTPVAPPVPPPAATGRSVKKVGHSGMPFNVTIFNQGSADQAAMTSQAANMGFASFDGGLEFATRDKGWAAAKDDQLAARIKGILDAGGIFILALPHSMDGDSLMNQKGAANAYKTDQVDFGRWLVSKGLNQDGLILRPDWEANGDWYHWTAAAPGGVAALRGAIKNFIDNVRGGGLTLAKYDASLNMPSTASSVAWADLWLGPGYWSYFTIDGYDAWPAVTSDALWEQKQSDVHSLRGALGQAEKFSTAAWPVMAGQDEGGNWHDPHGGGDNPYYWVCVFRELMKANERVCWLNIYNDNGAPANLFHGFASNPKAFAQVRQLVAGLLGP